MHGKCGLLFPGKANSHSTALPSLVVFVCAVFAYVHTTGCDAYSFTTDEYGIFNLRTNLGAWRVHEGGSGTNKSAQELTRRDIKENCVSPHPARESNHWSEELNSDSLTTVLPMER